MHLALPLLLLLATGPQDEARAARVLAVAERYATLPWHATEANAFHGEDPDGVPVDTPDAGLRAGGWTLAGDNVGVPYKWGGWATPEQFLEGIEAGRWAGHWPRDASDPRTTTGAVGVDCSGFVSRCWSLPYKHSMRSLGPLCWEIGWDELQPGDLLNSFDGHAILFKGWANEERTRVIGYEATWPKVVLKERRVDALRRGGLVPPGSNRRRAPGSA